MLEKRDYGLWLGNSPPPSIIISHQKLHGLSFLGREETMALKPSSHARLDSEQDLEGGGILERDLYYPSNLSYRLVGYVPRQKA